ncbi:hypothetical protein NQ314_014571 [Rhamnusium bicolor]|uniref:Uncharacterized protein n=1 Tax=Rhamnusium bicolor TaxID=1586634 RepID=A0AAV8X223_9CUCU|nr:hypothetical protein NQ314_014571 [Rhamnusium bicolor]
MSKKIIDTDIDENDMITNEEITIRNGRIEKSTEVKSKTEVKKENMREKKRNNKLSYKYYEMYMGFYMLQALLKTYHNLFKG